MRLAKFLNNKDNVSINNTTRCILSLYVVSLIAVGNTVWTTATGNACLLPKAYAQDLNPPTTGKTSPHVASTFGPNLPVHANRSTTDNGTNPTNTPR
ncbi:MAG TPA: hypothetical protein VJ729_07995 [Nitrososphaeraceae archaeon]|nr:hypothetical protein [Nitrososphaeraceae archaeon]